MVSIGGYPQRGIAAVGPACCTLVVAERTGMRRFPVGFLVVLAALLLTGGSLLGTSAVQAAPPTDPPAARAAPAHRHPDPDPAPADRLLDPGYPRAQQRVPRVGGSGSVRPQRGLGRRQYLLSGLLRAGPTLERHPVDQHQPAPHPPRRYLT